MRYFLDAEFIETGFSLQLVSIGIVSEDGRTFYAENTSFDERLADKWVEQNVLSKLQFWDWHKSESHFSETFGKGLSMQIFGTISNIKSSLLDFFQDDQSPEFWGYYADYDWVIFCWIFGRMIDLPKNFPMYCRDLKQLLDESDKEKIPDSENEHNALDDALWNLELYKHLTG
jgi:hypothetical protein